MAYQHFHLPVRSRGPIQTTIITTGVPRSVFSVPPMPSARNRGAPPRTPMDPQGRPGGSQGPPTTSQNPQVIPRKPENPPPGAPREAQGHPSPARPGFRDGPLNPARRNARSKWNKMGQGGETAPLPVFLYMLEIFDSIFMRF